MNYRHPCWSIIVPKEDAGTADPAPTDKSGHYYYVEDGHMVGYTYKFPILYVEGCWLIIGDAAPTANPHVPWMFVKCVSEEEADRLMEGMRQNSLGKQIPDSLRTVFNLLKL